MTDNTKITILDMKNSEGSSNLSIVTDGAGGYTHTLISGGAASGGASYLDDLLDVVAQSPPTVNDNEVLAFDSSSAKWINQSAVEAGLSAAGHTHQHDSLTVVTSDQHHAQVHGITSPNHSLTGSVSGYVLEALSATTFGFVPLAVLESQITDLDHDAVKLQSKPISSATPSLGDVLIYDGSQWAPDTASGIGAGTFLALLDTPSGYTGQAGKIPTVNTNETGLEFTTVSGVGAGARTQGGVYVATGTGTFTYTSTAVTDITDMDITFPITASGTNVFVSLTAQFQQTDSNWEIFTIIFELDNGQEASPGFTQYRESAKLNSERRLHTITYGFENLSAGTHLIKAQIDDGGSNADWSLSSTRTMTVIVPEGVNIT